MVTEQASQVGNIGPDRIWPLNGRCPVTWAVLLAVSAVITGCREHGQPIPGSAPNPATASSWIQVQPGLWIAPSRRELMMEGEVCLVDGWLEQVACSPGTREHESILVVTIPASSIHAGLLAAGLEPGRPGSWTRDNGVLQRVPPTGSEVDILVKPSGAETWEPVRRWIRDADGASPEGPWVFGGSTMLDSSDLPRGVSRYEADTSGSIIGLVTFGDETLGFLEVIPDEVVVAPEEWEVRTGAVPPLGSVVQVLVRPVTGGR